MSATTDTTPKTKGGWWALSPLAVFLCLYLVTSLLVNDFYKVPITVAFLASSCYAIAITRGLNLEQRIYQFSVGASNKNIMLMVWIFILAGAFAQSAKQMGAIDATVNLTLHILPDNLLLAGIFIAACFISLSIGTSVGTIVALTPVAVGLAEKTGIDLPYEATGLVANRRYKEKNFDDGEWYLSETFDAAIGQGFNLVTPLQAAMVMGEIAADGKRYKPHVVNRIIAPDGSVVKDFQPELLSQLDVPEEDIKLVQDGLHDVTKYGTAASSFRGFTVDIAGKTGTAENSQGRDHGWFVAYGPFDNPNIVVAVIVENGGYGSQSAVPIGRKILEAAFGLNQDSGDKK